MAKVRLPKFHKPPVVEAFCGISFQELQNLHAPQLGKLWDGIRRTYPRIETQPPLMTPLPGGVPTVIFGGPTQFRTWFLTDDKTILVQIQRDRLIVNWRKQESSVYPSFNVLSKHFTSVFAKFGRFINDLGLEALRFTGLEFGYVNVVPLAAPVSSTQDVTNIFPIFDLASKGSVLGSLSALNFQAQFDLLPENGQLHVTIQSTQRPNDGAPVLRCDLVSRWQSPQIVESGVLPWLTAAHEITVKAFVSITSRQIQKAEWERYQ